MPLPEWTLCDEARTLLFCLPEEFRDPVRKFASNMSNDRLSYIAFLDEFVLKIGQQIRELDAENDRLADRIDTLEDQLWRDDEYEDDDED